MNIYQAEKLLKDNCSRGALVEAFGCVQYYVPKKTVKEFSFLCNKHIPTGIFWSVRPLNCTSKKGNYAVVRMLDSESLAEAVKKFPKIFKKV